MLHGVLDRVYRLAMSLPEMASASCATARDIGWKAQVRLCTRYRRLRARGKTANVVNVAIAREMVGFIWSIACTVQSTLKTA